MPPYDGKYVSNAEVRSEGVSSSSGDPFYASDADVDRCIKQAERDLEEKCGRWFYRRQAHTITLDGGDTHFALLMADEGKQTLFLPVPIITLTSITINSTSRTMGDFIVLNRIGAPADDRWNPRIISKNYEFPQDGIQNIVLVGDFGFVEDTVDYTVPEQIRTAARKLTIRYLGLKKMTDPEREMELNQGHIVSEETPGYRYTLGRNYQRGVPRYTGDTEIDDIIERYRYKRYLVGVAI